MGHGLTALERAFQLAKDGSCHSVLDIKKQLRAEGFSITQITGKSLYKQLRGLLQGRGNADSPTAQGCSVLCGHDQSPGCPSGSPEHRWELTPDPETEAPSD
jgi:hypothetical protein